MHILELNLIPLNDEEMKKFTKHYTQRFDTMTIPEAQKLLKMLVSAKSIKGSFDPEIHDLLIRRLYMILEWDKYPERLI